MIRIRVDDNTPELKRELRVKMEKILFEIGLKWQETAKKLLTQQDEVVTGRLRASMSFITNKRKSPNVSAHASEPGDWLEGTSDSLNKLVVGSNVPYASKNELENRKGAFVKPALLRNKDVFENIAEDILKS